MSEQITLTAMKEGYLQAIAEVQSFANAMGTKRVDTLRLVKDIVYDNFCLALEGEDLEEMVEIFQTVSNVIVNTLHEGYEERDFYSSMKENQ